MNKVRAHERPFRIAPLSHFTMGGVVANKNGDTGVDVSGLDDAIDTGQITHAFNSHGPGNDARGSRRQTCIQGRQDPEKALRHGQQSAGGNDRELRANRGRRCSQINADFQTTIRNNFLMPW